MNTEGRLLLACLSAAGARRRSLGARLMKQPLEQVAACPEFTPRARDWARADGQLLVMHKLGLRMLMGAEIPPRLRQGQPAALFVRGAEGNLRRPALAVVGSRDATASACRWADEIAQEAARAGWMVVSGGARGVDRATHEGALRAGAPTVVYLGVAADRIYPARNRAFLGEVLRRGGTLVSEHPPGAETLPFDHARRNRLIAAHATAVWVAEAAAASGSLGTARWARRLGKGVWISPPGVGRARAGLNILVEEGEGGVWQAGRRIPPPWAGEELRPAPGQPTLHQFSASAAALGKV